MLCAVNMNCEYTWIPIWWDVDWYVLNDEYETATISEKCWLYMNYDNMTVYMTDQINE